MGEEPSRDDFDTDVLNIHFQTLRSPLSEEFLSLKERPGYLRLKGYESLSSWNKQVLVARRQQSFHYIATTCIEYEPASFQNMAGLICYYDTRNFYYIHISFDEEIGIYLDIMTCIAGNFDYPLNEKIIINGVKRCYLRAIVDYDNLVFLYSLDEKNWKKIGNNFDSSTLSDEFDTIDIYRILQEPL